MKKRKLVYPSSVNLSDKSAQAIQISEMRSAFEKIYGEDFIYYGVKNDGDAALGIEDRPGKLQRSILILFGILRSVKSDYDVFTREIFFAFLFTLLGRRVVWECHQSTSAVVKILLRLCSLSSRFKVLSISEALSCSKEIPVSHVNKYHFHDGVALESLDKLGGDVSYFDEPGKYAVYTGALHKGRDVDSLEPLFKAFPDWNFVIVGGAPGNVEIYKKRFSKYENVTLLGRRPREDVITIQKSASVLLYPLTRSNTLWRYTSPLKLFEYMAAKKPIVGSNIGSVSELLGEHNAFVFDGEFGVVDAFRRFLSAPDNEVLDMIESNYSSLIERYNWDVRAKFIVDEIFTA